MKKKVGKKAIKTKLGKNLLPRSLAIAAAIILILVASFGFYFWRKASGNNLGGELTPEQIKKLVDKVSEIAVLPQDELPIVGNVNDPIQIKNQPFFENAQAGDLIIIYKQARKVFLYNPKLHKIVNIAPYSQRSVSQTQQATVSATPTFLETTPSSSLIEITATPTPTASPFPSP